MDISTQVSEPSLFSDKSEEIHASHSPFMPIEDAFYLQLSSNCDLDLDTSLNIDDDLLDNLGWCVETDAVSIPSSIGYAARNLLDQTFMNTHLEAIPGLGTFTTRGFTGGNF
jgi:hypothetical protein